MYSKFFIYCKGDHPSFQYKFKKKGKLSSLIRTFEYVKLERFRLLNIRITKSPPNPADLCLQDAGRVWDRRKKQLMRLVSGPEDDGDKCILEGRSHWLVRGDWDSSWDRCVPTVPGHPSFRFGTSTPAPTRPGGDWSSRLRSSFRVGSRRPVPRRAQPGSPARSLRTLWMASEAAGQQYIQRGREHWVHNPTWSQSEVLLGRESGTGIPRRQTRPPSAFAAGIPTWTFPH